MRIITMVFEVDDESYDEFVESYGEVNDWAFGEICQNYGLGFMTKCTVQTFADEAEEEE